MSALDPQGAVLPFVAPEREALERRSVLGMKLFIASLGVAFLALFLFYGLLRAQQAAWPPDGLPRVPLLLPTANTVVVAVSSLLFHRALVAVREGAARRFSRALAGAALFGALFIGLQGALAHEAISLGIEAGGSVYASLMFTLAGFHAVHVLGGLAVLAVFCGRAWGGSFSPARHLPVRMLALYWHFVGAVWLVMYLAVFVL